MVDQNAYHKHQPEDFIPSYRYMEIIPKIEKMLKLDNNKLQRPVYFNKSLYIAKDNSIIRLN